MDKLKNLIAAILIMAAISCTSCSTGVVIPQPVCEYSLYICETLHYLCDKSNPNHLSAKENENLEAYLKVFNVILQEYKLKASGK